MSTDMQEYETVKPVSRSMKNTPIVQMNVVPGSFLKGILLSKKSFDTGETNERGEKVIKLIATFKLIETDAPAILKGAQGYAPTELTPGMEVTLYGPPSRLERALMAVEDGGKYEVFIQYEGKKSEVVNGRKVKPHVFKVGKKAVAVVAATTDEGVPD